MSSQTEYESRISNTQPVSKIKITRIENAKTRFQIRFEDAKKTSLSTSNRQQRVCYLSHKFSSLTNHNKPQVNILGWSLDENNNSISKQSKLTRMLNECDLKYKQDSFIECNKSSKCNLVLYALLDLIARKINAQLQHKPLVSKLKQLLTREALISRELLNQQNKLSDSYAFSKLHSQQTVFTVFNEIILKYNIKNTSKITPRRFEPKQIEFNQNKFENDLKEMTTFIMNVLIRINLHNQKVCADLQLKHKSEHKYARDLMRKNELFAKFLNCFNYSNFLNDSDLCSDELKSHELYKSIYDSLLVQSELIISNDSLNDMNTKFMNTDLQVWFEYFEVAKVFYKHFNDLKLLEEAKLVAFDYNLFTFAIEFKFFMADFVHVLRLESMLLDELISCSLSPIKVLIDLNSNGTSTDPRKLFTNKKSVDFDLIKFNNSKKKASPSNLDESIEIQRANETLVKYKTKAEQIKLNESELEKLLSFNQPIAYLTPMSSPLNNLVLNSSNQNACSESQISTTNLNLDSQIESIDLNELMSIDFESFEIGILKTSTQINQANNDLIDQEKPLLNNVSNQDSLIKLNSLDFVNQNDEISNTNLAEQESFLSVKDCPLVGFDQPIESNSLQIAMNKEIDANQVVEASTTNNEDFSEVLVDCEDFLNSNSCVQVNEPIVIKSLESSQEQTDSIDDLNTRIGGKPILQIIPRPELVVFPLEASVETALEANAPSLTESVIDVNNDQEKHKIAEPSRNLLKSSILAESDSPKREESFQAIKDSLKQAASNLNKKMKNVNETLPSGEKNSTDNNKSNNDKSNEIVFCKV